MHTQSSDRYILLIEQSYCFICIHATRACKTVVAIYSMLNIIETKTHIQTRITVYCYIDTYNSRVRVDSVTPISMHVHLLTHCSIKGCLFYSTP